MVQLIVFLALLLASPAFSEDDPFESIHRSLKDEAFVVETSDEDAAESLNRVSGKIDLGFAGEDYAYQSEHHYGAGPFAQSAAKDKLYYE